MRDYKLIRLAAILLIMIMYASTAEAGLIGWYPLHGDASAIVGNNGTLSSVDAPTPAPDQNGNANGALRFQADPGNSSGYSRTNTGSYVSVPNGGGLAGLQEFSIAMWVNWSGMQGTGWTGGGDTNYGSVIARQGNGVYSNNVLGISDPDPNVGVLTFHAYGAGAFDAMGVTPVGDNVWHFVAVAVDGSTGEIDVYLDGNLEVTNTYTTAAGPPYTLNTDTTAPLTIGAWIGDGATYSNSTIDNVYLFDSYLSQTDIQNLQATGPFAWHGPTTTITTGVSGNPSFVQATPGTYGTKGNYELVVPLQSGGIAHFYRNNDDPSMPWSGPFPFATEQGAADAVSLIQSNFSSAGNGPGNLAVVARIGNALDYYFREDVTFTWSGPTTITTGVSGVPSFVQATPGTYGTKGNYELVTPLQSGGMAHFYRNNDDASMPWIGPVTFGTNVGLVDAVSLVQSHFSTHFVQTGVQGPGNLAVVARVGSDLLYFYRDDVAPFAWHGPATTIATGVTGTPSFVQARPGTYGTLGNYELVVPLESGGIAHFYRNNDDPSQPWIGPTATFGTALGAAAGVSLIQSNFSTAGNGPGNLAVVSIAGNQLDYFYRDDQ